MAQTSRSNWIDACLGCLRSCFGFYKSFCGPVFGDEDHHNSKEIDEQGSQKPLLYDSFLSSSTYDPEHSYFHMNNSSLQSLERGNSFFNQQPEASSVDSHGFRNHGLHHWNETRQQWLDRNRMQRRKSQEHNNPRISWNATYENLLGTNRRFHQPIPLSEMVDFLVDVWEQEGLYDNTTFGIL